MSVKLVRIFRQLVIFTLTVGIVLSPVHLVNLSAGAFTQDEPVRFPELEERCAPEVISSLPANNYSCQVGPEGDPLEVWRTPLREWGIHGVYPPYFMFESGGSVYLLSDGSLYLLDIANRELTAIGWNIQGDYVASSNGILLTVMKPFTHVNSVIHATDLNSGRLLWMFSPSEHWDGNDYTFRHVIADGKLFLYGIRGISDGKASLLGVNLFSGNLKIDVPLPAVNGLRVVITDSAYYVAFGVGEARKLDLTTGSEIWRVSQAQFSGLVGINTYGWYGYGMPIVIGDELHISYARDSASGYNAVLSVDDGRVLSEGRTDSLCIPLVSTSGQLRCGSGATRVHNGSQAWFSSYDFNRVGQLSLEMLPEETSSRQIMEDTEALAFYTNRNHLSFGIYSFQVSSGFLVVASENELVVFEGVSPGSQPGVGLTVGERAEVSGEGVVLRGAPSHGSLDVQQMSPGEVVVLLDGPFEEDGDTWWLVQVPANGSSGYIPASNLVKAVESATESQVAEEPSEPESQSLEEDIPVQVIDTATQEPLVPNIQTWHSRGHYSSEYHWSITYDESLWQLAEAPTDDPALTMVWRSQEQDSSMYVNISTITTENIYATSYPGLMDDMHLCLDAFRGPYEFHGMRWVDRGEDIVDLDLPPGSLIEVMFQTEGDGAGMILVCTPIIDGELLLFMTMFNVGPLDALYDRIPLMDDLVNGITISD